MVPFFKMEWAAGAAAGLGNNVDIPSNGLNIGLEVNNNNVYVWWPPDPGSPRSVVIST